MVKLEVGGSYVDADGLRIELEYHWNDFWPFKSKVHGEYRYYRSSGKSYKSDHAAIIAELTNEPAEVIGENVRVVPIDEAPNEVFDRMAETRSKPYDAPRSKYHRIIKGVEVDIYDILVAWGVTCPARQHAIKKLLMAGERGAKGVAQDLDEAIQATERAKELV